MTPRGKARGKPRAYPRIESSAPRTGASTTPSSDHEEAKRSQHASSPLTDPSCSRATQIWQRIATPAMRRRGKDSTDAPMRASGSAPCAPPVSENPSPIGHGTSSEASR
jgi:hypothetical protein